MAPGGWVVSGYLICFRVKSSTGGVRLDLLHIFPKLVKQGLVAQYDANYEILAPGAPGKPVNQPLSVI